MAWNEDVITARHPSTQATAMSVDFSGKLALLGSRRHLTLIDLDEPKAVLRRINLNSKWDISRVTWNPFLCNQNYFLTTYNQWTDLWHCTETSGSRIATFSGHTRAISDVDWSSMDPNLMATCSLDTYIYLWDIRETKKPKLVASTVSGASRVRWNKTDENTMASSHDGNIRIWDIRNAKTPLQYITAHVSKINYLDWSPSMQHELCSASQDTKISFWNTTEKPREADFQIHVHFPVWRAEYTPFGRSVLSVALRSFRETPVTLWNIDESNQSIHTYNHTDVVLDFHWRMQSGGRWQLVTWSKDQILRLWHADHNLLLSCGATDVDNDLVEDDISSVHDTPKEELYIKAREKPPSSLSSAGTHESDGLGCGTTSLDVPETLSLPEHSITASSSPSSGSANKTRASTFSVPHTLDHEFTLLNACLPNLIVNKMDQIRRLCTVSLRTSSQHLVLQIHFPILYPQNEAPVFKFTDCSESINEETREDFLITLRETAQHHVRNNRVCLEPCLRQLTTQFRELSYSTDKPDYDHEPLYPNHPFAQCFATVSSQRSDLHNIPFPRTSGARFCSAGYLVVFMRPLHVKGFHTSSNKTPRSFASLFNHRYSAPVLPRVRFDAAYAGPNQAIYSTSQTSTPKSLVSNYYYKDKRLSKRSLKYFYNPYTKESENAPVASTVTSKDSKHLQSAGKVIVIDLTRILPISKNLGQQYIVPEDHNFSNACRHNRDKAQSEDMSDLVQLWSCVALLPTKTATKKNEFTSPFQSSPFGRKFLSNLVLHYSRLRDVQTLAMLSCTFGDGKKFTSKSEYQDHSISSSARVRRSISQNNFELPNSETYGLHKSSSESRFPDPPGFSSWLTNMIARSPSNESAFPKHFRSTSESPPDDYRFEESAFIDEQNNDQDNWENDCQMLDSVQDAQHEAFKSSYCDLLSRWGLNLKVAEIRKHTEAQNHPETLSFKSSCQSCDERSVCLKNNCSAFTFRCLICQLPVEGLWSFCSCCFHGGHTDHMEAWFNKNDYCPSPSNCSCQCTLITRETD